MCGRIKYDDDKYVDLGKWLRSWRYSVFMFQIPCGFRSDHVSLHALYLSGGKTYRVTLKVEKLSLIGDAEAVWYRLAVLVLAPVI